MTIIITRHCFPFSTFSIVSTKQYYNRGWWLKTDSLLYLFNSQYMKCPGKHRHALWKRCVVLDWEDSSLACLNRTTLHYRHISHECLNRTTLHYRHSSLECLNRTTLHYRQWQPVPVKYRTRGNDSCLLSLMRDMKDEECMSRDCLKSSF
jgi:hypothetical protein